MKAYFNLHGYFSSIIDIPEITPYYTIAVFDEPTLVDIVNEGNHIYDNSNCGTHKLIFRYDGTHMIKIIDKDTWIPKYILHRID